MNNTAFAAFADSDINTEVPTSSLYPAVPDWLPPVRRRLEELSSLEKDWDSYGARPIDPENARAAVELLQLVMDDDLLVPEIVPTVDGGVQLEWEAGDEFLEVEVLNRTHFLCLDSSMDEFEVRFDVSKLKERLAKFRRSAD